jgi:hypothetical protein
VSNCDDPGFLSPSVTIESFSLKFYKEIILPLILESADLGHFLPPFPSKSLKFDLIRKAAGSGQLPKDFPPFFSFFNP